MQVTSPARSLDLRGGRSGQALAQPFSLYGHLVFLGLTIVGSGLSRGADDVIYAAGARAFSNQLAGGSLTSPRIVARRGDYLLAGLALALIVAILAL